MMILLRVQEAVAQNAPPCRKSLEGSPSVRNRHGYRYQNLGVNIYQVR
jgi:hypothetical protein